MITRRPPRDRCRSSTQDALNHIARLAITVSNMTRTIYLENWHTWIQPTIDDILLAAGKSGPDTPAQVALLAERNVLQEMMRHIRNVAPGKRQELKSPLIACTVHDAVNVPTTIVERVGEIHDIYRRFRNRMMWPMMNDGQVD